ncbi:MAG: hypothetical protein CFE21_09190 [Bacteroidetes bacterium B1(2017)]|nr:MAG: hypothetical protein CFE21_09190 [Bacteroidetes bacterium B1(2017)]
MAFKSELSFLKNDKKLGSEYGIIRSENKNEIFFSKFDYNQFKLIEPINLGIENTKSIPAAYIIEFKKDSIKIDQEGRNKIDGFIKVYLELTKEYGSSSSFSKNGTEKDSTFYSFNVAIALAPVCCLDEYNKNQFIGVMRASSIAEYIENKYYIPRSEITINDKSCKSDDYDSCIHKGIRINLFHK